MHGLLRIFYVESMNGTMTIDAKCSGSFSGARVEHIRNGALSSLVAVRVATLNDIFYVICRMLMIWGIGNYSCTYTPSSVKGTSRLAFSVYTAIIDFWLRELISELAHCLFHIPSLCKYIVI